MRRSLLTAACVLFALGLLTGGSPFRAPEDPIVTIEAAQGTAEAQPVGPGSYAARGLFFVYQNLIGPTKGSQCPMTPSCSEYGRIAVQSHGLGQGILMAGDRIHRCGHDLYYYDKAVTRDGVVNEDFLPR